MRKVEKIGPVALVIININSRKPPPNRHLIGINWLRTSVVATVRYVQERTFAEVNGRSAKGQKQKSSTAAPTILDGLLDRHLGGAHP
jgi:hypothetical protein